MAWKRSESTIFAYLGDCRVLCRRLKRDRLNLQPQVVNCFLNQVRILLADVLKLR